MSTLMWLLHHDSPRFSKVYWHVQYYSRNKFLCCVVRKWNTSVKFSISCRVSFCMAHRAIENSILLPQPRAGQYELKQFSSYFSIRFTYVEQWNLFPLLVCSSYAIQFKHLVLSQICYSVSYFCMSRVTPCNFTCISQHAW